MTFPIFILLTGIQFATNEQSSFRYAMNTEATPSIVPIVSTNVDPDCLCPSGACWGTNEDCTAPTVQSVFNLSWAIDQSEPSITEVWHSTGDVSHWNLLALVIGTNLVVTNNWSPMVTLYNGTNVYIATNWSSEFFRVRSTCPGFISDWATR